MAPMCHGRGHGLCRCTSCMLMVTLHSVSVFCGCEGGGKLCPASARISLPLMSCAKAQLMVNYFRWHGASSRTLLVLVPC